MFGKLTLALGTAGLLGVGALAVVAADSHGDAVRTVAQAAATGEAHGDAVSAAARARGLAARSDAKADAAARKAERDADAAAREAERDTDEAADIDSARTGEKDGHGDLVSGKAKSDCTGTHDKGKAKANHGGCVSEVASKRA